MCRWLLGQVSSSTVSVFQLNDEQVSLSWLREQSFKDTLIPTPPGKPWSSVQLNSTQSNSTQLNSAPLLLLPLIRGDSLPLVKMSPGGAERLKQISEYATRCLLLYTLSLHPRESSILEMTTSPTKQNKSNRHKLLLSSCSSLPTSGGPVF
jgi:hypothetical protein